MSPRIHSLNDGPQPTGTAETEKKDSKAKRQSGGGEVLLTRPELAAKCGWSVRTVDRLVKAKTIPHVRTGRLVRFKLDAVMAALARNSTVEAR